MSVIGLQWSEAEGTRKGDGGREVNEGKFARVKANSSLLSQLLLQLLTFGHMTTSTNSSPLCPT